MFVQFNPNPRGARVGDCAVRAICKALNYNWNRAYARLTVEGLTLCDLPSANNVWGSLLKKHGFKRQILPDTCPDCYTIRDFCEEHPNGIFVVAVANHVVCVKDGNLYDSWDSSSEMPIYYWRKDV